MLYLAECLGGAFGVAIKQNSWCVDSPFQAMPTDMKASLSMSGADVFSAVHKIASLFVSELLSGIHSCCIWIEEKQDSDLSSSKKTVLVQKRFGGNLKQRRRHSAGDSQAVS